MTGVKLLYNFDFEYSALLFLIIIFIYHRRQYTTASVLNNMFRTLNIGIFFVVVSDILSGLGISYYMVVPAIPNAIIQGSNFALVAWVAYYFTVYIQTMANDGQKTSIPINKIICYTFIVSEVLNLFFGYYYTFSMVDGYKHGALYMVQVVVDIYFVIFSMFQIGIERKKFNKRQYFAAVSYVVLMIAGSLFQLFVMTDALISGYGCTVVLLIILFTLETPDYLKLQETMVELEESREEANLANKAKSSFLANMSHEIRTPINTILGLDTMILRESKDNKIKNYAINIQSASQNLLSIINDILDFSKIESGKMEIIPVEYDLSSLVNDIVTMISVKAEDKGLIFDVEVDETIPNRLFGDDVRIKQVLINLLTNAVKYTNQGSVLLSITGKKEDGIEKLLVSVKDTGIGIKEENIESLFQEFVRIEEKRNRNIEGTGLGINIVISFLNLMGSKLQVSSVYGEGSNFYFEIEQKIVDEEPIGNIQERISKYVNDYSYVAKFRIPDAKLLVVDDNGMNRLVFRELLSDLECEIQEAESGKQCLELVKETKYDIIFMDHMMPDMDGIETLQCMKELEEYANKNTPVVILTANAIAGAKEEYLAAGFDNYLSKPIDADKLEDLIGELVSDDIKLEAKPKDKDELSKEMDIACIQCDLPSVEGVDFEAALYKLKNKKVLLSSIDSFKRTASVELESLKEMKKAIDDNPQDESVLADFRIKVHAMKAASATIGATDVSSLAKILEYAARDNKVNVIDALFDTFVLDWTVLVEALKKEFIEEDNDDKNLQIEKEALEALLDKLIKAVGDIDIAVADDIVNELKKYSFDDNGKNLLEKLIVSVENLDADATKKAVEEYRANE